MENISSNKLKKGLSKIKSLNYKYDDKKKQLTTDSMIRKPRRIEL